MVAAGPLEPIGNTLSDTGLKDGLGLQQRQRVVGVVLLLIQKPFGNSIPIGTICSTDSLVHDGGVGSFDLFAERPRENGPNNISKA